MENITPICTVGDLVMVKGFGNRVWRVESSSKKMSFENGDSKSVVTYTFSCVVSNEYISAEQANVMLVCKSSYASTYLSILDKSGKPPTRKKEVAANSNRSPSPIKHSDTKRLDELLDQMGRIFSARDLLGGISDELEDDLYKCEEELYDLGEKNGWFK